ncbi:MAG: signal transduction histidine kinase, partial [Hyphomicrobiaceae bacterium]
RTEEVRRALERQTATSEILRVISSSPTDSQPVFEAILQRAGSICGASLGVMFLVRDENLHPAAWLEATEEFRATVEANPLPLSAKDSYAHWSAATGEIVHIEDLSDGTHPSIDSGPGWRLRQVSIKAERIRTLLCIPMRKGDKPIGVLCLFRREKHLFKAEDIELLSTFAEQAVIAIDNVRLFQTLQFQRAELTRSVGELRALGEVGQAVSSTLDLDTVLTTITSQAVELCGAAGGIITEYDEATGTLPIRAAPGFSHLVGGVEPTRIGEGVIGKAAADRKPVHIPDLDAPGAYPGKLRHLLDQAGLKALLAVPLLREDKVLGTLLVGRATTGEFAQTTINLLETFAAQSALAIHNARVYQELEEQGRALDAANRHKSEFLANMSHELRTPLNAVIGFSEVLGDELFGELNEKQTEYVGDIHESGRHLLSLINDILDLSKVEAGHMELNLARFALQPAIDNALTLVSERAAQRGLTLTSHTGELPDEMVGDERKLKQILLNLLSNSIKFTPAGGEVTLTGRCANGWVEIEVKDTGVGISAEEQTRVFDAFQQAGRDYARKAEGTGLGLTLTRQFVELHGGSIKVASAPEQGSTFTIMLPLEQGVGEQK